jgi:hypothetical protein
MKLEPRGKYAGVKVHLDADECQALMIAFPEGSKAHKDFAVYSFPGKLAGKLHKLVKEFPDMLEDKSDDHVEAVLKAEAIKANAKLKALAIGADWQHTKE